MNNKSAFGIRLVALGLLLASLFLGGCASGTKNVDLDRFKPVNADSLQEVTVFDEIFYVSENNKYDLTFSLLQYQSLMVLPLYIKNKTNDTVQPEDYSIALFDGRDLMPIRMLTLNDLKAIRNKNANPQGFNLLNPSVQGAVSAVDSLIKLPGNTSVNSSFDYIQNNYFSFRPLYANETRYGALVFFHDFKLELPVTLIITIKGERNVFFFNPIKTK